AHMNVGSSRIFSAVARLDGARIDRKAHVNTGRRIGANVQTANWRMQMDIFGIAILVFVGGASGQAEENADGQHRDGKNLPGFSCGFHAENSRTQLLVEVLETSCVHAQPSYGKANALCDQDT